MKIIAGSLKGLNFLAPNGNQTHPMSERVRGALFNILGDVEGLSVLDGYGGSGALGFEAISRGASFAYFVENDKKAASIINKNIKDLGVASKTKITQANVEFWSKRNQDKQFDLVLLDPPYDQIDLSTVSELTRHVKSNGLMVLSYPGRESTPAVNGVVVVDDRSYGDAALAFYRLDA